ncbi:MAG: aminotransferase class I/II-fold pyridoxal phosphate-dependent enzyme [Gammaproteobacteria bacterium]|nr:aminotransferase class I/II-fold pyridoxal phosphate-dependent enzyme [Gammaproteobacteria bacterium]
MQSRLYDCLGIDKSMKFIAGNGSDELIMLLMLLCGTARGGKVLSPSPSFSMYRHLTQALGGEFIGVDLNADFTLDLDKFAEEIKKHRPQLVFLSQPNNPTGNLFPQEAAEIAAELLQASGLVVVDRAYEFFSRSNDGNDGAANEDSSYSKTLATKYPNLINLYTLSKIGVAGLRFGFAVGHKEVIHELSKLRLPYNINTLTCASIEFMTDNLSHFTKWADEIKESRDELSRQMMQMPGIQVFPSSTNFLLFRLLGDANSAAACVDYLQQNKVLIKSFDGYHDSLKNCLRVSLGTADENSLFLKQLEAYLKQTD